MSFIKLAGCFYGVLTPHEIQEKWAAQEIKSGESHSKFVHFAKWCQ